LQRDQSAGCIFIDCVYCDTAAPQKNIMENSALRIYHSCDHHWEQSPDRADSFLYHLWGEKVLQWSWHIALGYVQIIFAFAIFLVIGKIFSESDRKLAEEQQ
jgi:hypothetical protein